MTKKYGKNSPEELVISYLKKNKNFFIQYQELIKELNFPLKDKSSEKVVDLEAYRYKKISQQNIDLQNQMTKILIAGKNHQNAQKRIKKHKKQTCQTYETHCKIFVSHVFNRSALPAGLYFGCFCIDFH